MIFLGYILDTEGGGERKCGRRERVDQTMRVWYLLAHGVVRLRLKSRRFLDFLSLYFNILPFVYIAYNVYIHIYSDCQGKYLNSDRDVGQKQLALNSRSLLNFY